MEPVAADVMLPPTAIAALLPDTTVREALEQMLQSKARALPISEGPRVEGVVTLADLARCVHSNRGAPSISRVDTLMRPPASVAPDTPLSAVRALMARESTELLVVTSRNGETAGYISTESALAAEPGRPETGGGRPTMRVPCAPV
jgi:CBS domain-containing protein